MSNCSVLFIFTLCVVSSFAANLELQTVTYKFRNAFNETNSSKNLHLNESDKKFYVALRSLITSQETGALQSALVYLLQEHSKSIDVLSANLKKINDLLSIISTLKMHGNEQQLNFNSEELFTHLEETVNLLKQKPLKPLTFTQVFATQNVEHLTNQESLLVNLNEIVGDSDLGRNFTSTFKVNGEEKFLEIRDWYVANCRSKRSLKEAAKKVGHFACKALEVFTKYAPFEKYIAQWIYKHVPNPYKSEMLNTLIQKGILTVTNMARTLCGQEVVPGYLSHIKATEGSVNAIIVQDRTIFGIYRNLFPKKEVDFVFFKSFVHWYRMSLQNAFVSIQTDVDTIAAQMKKNIQKVSLEMSDKANQVLTLYGDDLKVDHLLKHSIRFRAIDLKNTLHF